MNAQTMAKMAYAQSATPVRTTRGTEYDVLARVTHAIKAAESRGKAGFQDLAQAIFENRRLWTILATDVADSENALPDDLRARVYYLAEFTDQHSSKVLRGEAKASVLVEINAAIMRGLRQGVGV